jgi:uncharacterized protein with HEPN domain
MVDRAIWRLGDIKKSIVEIRSRLLGKSFDEMYGEPVTRAAFARFLEILSEASRHVPDEWKETHGREVPWRCVADLGNHIRHAYHRLDAQALWLMYENDLGPLERAVDAMLATYGPAVSSR